MKKSNMIIGGILVLGAGLLLTSTKQVDTPFSGAGGYGGYDSEYANGSGFTNSDSETVFDTNPKISDEEFLKTTFESNYVPSGAYKTTSTDFGQVYTDKMGNVLGGSNFKSMQSMTASETNKQLQGLYNSNTPYKSATFNKSTGSYQYGVFQSTQTPDKFTAYPSVFSKMKDKNYSSNPKSSSAITGQSALSGFQKAQADYQASTKASGKASYHATANSQGKHYY